MRVALLLLAVWLVPASRPHTEPPMLHVTFDDADDPVAQQLAEHEHNQIVLDAGVDGTPGLRTRYVGGDMGSERVVVSPMLAEPMTEATLIFDVRFAEDFQFVMGGKLHGLGPVNRTTGGNDVRPDGWSARLMWRGDGTIITYVYHQNRPGKWGDAKAAEQFRFVPGQWHHVELTVKVNDPPAASNGSVRLAIDGQQLVEHTGLQLRAEPGDHTLINRLLFSTFHGGNTPDWAPKNDDGSYATTHADFDNFRITTPAD